MRRTGTTTRTIDRAIQTLFTQNKIFIPKNDGQLMQYVNSWSFRHAIEVTITETVFLKPLVTDLQQDLYDRILKRLKLEHSHLFDNDVIIVNHNSFGLKKPLEDKFYSEETTA